MIVQSVLTGGRMVATIRDGGGFARDVRTAAAGRHDRLSVHLSRFDEVTFSPGILTILCTNRAGTERRNGIAFHETTAGSIVNIWPNVPGLFAIGDDHAWREALQRVRLELADSRALDPRWVQLYRLEWADIPHDEERVTVLEAPPPLAPTPAASARRHRKGMAEIREWVRSALAFRSAP